MPTPVPCLVTEWSPTSIRCTVPPGLDAQVLLSVVVGGQVVTLPSAFSYMGPSVGAVNASSAPGTPGGGEILVFGAGLPLTPWPLAVTVGDGLCSIQFRNASLVSCLVPRGCGAAPVVLHTPLQRSVEAAQVVYASPIVHSVDTPQGRPVDGGFPVLVQGQVL